MKLKSESTKVHPIREPTVCVPPEVHTEQKEAGPEERGMSIKATIEDAAMNTGAHGIANIYRTRNIARKIFWCVIFFAGLGLLCWQVTTLVMKYLTYPTQTTVQYLDDTSLPFPAVTVCNNNPYRRTHATNVTDINDFLEDVYGSWVNPWEQENATRSSSARWDTVTEAPSYSYDFDDYEYDSDYRAYSGDENEEFDVLEDFLSLMSTYPLSQRIQMGHQLSEMIIDCTWQGRDCRPSQFYQFHNYLYGNCFTFNSGRSAQVLRTGKEGPLYAFRLGLFVNQQEYIPGIADGAGIRLVIHNQTEMPLPDEQGVNLKTGSKTSVALSRKVIQRANPPYGTCKDYGKRENKQNNAFLGDFEDIGYSVTACKKTCYQRALLEKCHCYDYRVPVDIQLRAYDTIDRTDVRGGCHNDSASFTSCLDEVTLDFVNDDLDCRETCKDKCLEVMYQKELSTLEWPSISTTDRVMSKLAESNDDLWEDLTNSSWGDNERKLFVRENFVKLEVYFKTFNYEHIETTPAYELFQLISDVGGQTGLWLGLSMVAVFELVELISDLCIIAVRKCRERRKRKLEGADNPEDPWASTKRPNGAHNV